MHVPVTRVQLRPGASPQGECIAQREELPDYKELEELLRGTEGSMSSKPLMERLQSEAAFLRNSLKETQQPPKE
jgi:hypothetical protein